MTPVMQLEINPAGELLKVKFHPGIYPGGGFLENPGRVSNGKY
jgi:hypothetical protein